MKAAVIGPGAMGCLYAARLAHSGVKTWLVDHKQARADRLEKTGVVVEDRDGHTLLEHPVIAAHVPTGMDFVLVLVKAYSTPSLRLPPETPVLTLQNGLGNVETLCTMVGSARLMVGATTEAATLVSEGRVRHMASGVTSFGAWTSCSCAAVRESLINAGFKVELTESPGQLVWEKVAINAGINPLTALLNVPNGRLLQIMEIRQLMRDLVVEATKVASTEGYRFNQSLVEMTEAVCARTADNISSMLQDVRAGRQTEIDAISGEIMRRAQLASLPTPRTRVVYQLVRGLEGR
ncbi:MAG TPA: 2-dehydropantoate 2-reductase [Candidatus Hydrogenedentes bacterium]|nr:2-dehydropantoate 2-reductase [Candidatus Hydrogenedentota bacterium]